MFCCCCRRGPERQRVIKIKTVTTTTQPAAARPTPSQAQQEALEKHNYYRKIHGAKPLKLDPKLCKFVPFRNTKPCRISQAYAEKLAALNLLRHSNVANYGENLAFGTFPHRSVGDLVTLWYDESKDYNFKKPDFSPKTGHFTQLVWNGSERLGVGVAFNGSSLFLVANYDPPGNVISHFHEHVFDKGGKKVTPK